MAIVPLSGTDIRILSGVPFHNDYKHTRYFSSKTEQTNWFMNQSVVHLVGQSNFQREEGRSYLAVNKHIEDLFGANYVMFRNTAYSNKWFYGFVTTLEYKQKNNTHVHFELDVFQTWLFDMDFQPSFTVREHRKLWNSDGTPVINTIDEGLDYGSDYNTVGTVVYRNIGQYKYLVIVAKTPFHLDTPEVMSNVIGTVQPLSYYVVPFSDDDDTPTVVIDGGDSYVCSKPSLVLNAIYKDESAVNNIVSLYVTENVGLRDNLIVASPQNVLHINTAGLGLVGFVNFGSPAISILKVEKLNTFYQKEALVSGNKYLGLDEVEESKLLMYPYTQLVLDDFKGNRATYKLEYIGRNDITLRTKGSLGTSNYVSYAVKDYNLPSGTGYQDHISDETALIDNTPSDVPIITDMLAAYMQGNRNSLQNQKNSTIFNGVMDSVGGAIGGFASASQGNAAGVASSVASGIKGSGNTVLALQGIQAKQKDIDNTPPQITKMGTNTAYHYGNLYDGVYVMKKQIKPEYRRQLSDFFKMYGYKTNEVKVPNFKTRQNWNYVQTVSCIIRGNFNNEDLQELKSVFDNGITLWHTDDIGNYNLANGVR